MNSPLVRNLSPTVRMNVRLLLEFLCLEMTQLEAQYYRINY